MVSWLKALWGGGGETWVLCWTLSCTMGLMASSRSLIIAAEIDGADFNGSWIDNWVYRRHVSKGIWVMTSL